MAVLTDIENQIQAARGGGGLKGKDANDLLNRVASIREALNEGELDTARNRANDLENALHDNADRLGEQRAQQLLDAVGNLRSILG
jgi:hypothetical protein